MPAPTKIKIGPLKPAEIPEADRIFRLAFGTFLGLPDPASFMGDRDLVASRVRASHVKALAARQKGRLIGFNLLTTWGAFAFFGPLCVLPDYWDKGVAQKLLEATVAAFDKDKLPRTALFTFPHSAKHVGLYNKYGYWPQNLTALFRYTPDPKRVATYAPGTRTATLSTLYRKASEEAIAACLKLTDRIDKGLDLTKEIRALLKQKTGEVLLIHTRNTIEGFAIVYTGPRSEGGAELCYVKFAAVRGGAAADDRFDHLLDAIENFARSRKIAVEFGLSFACQAAHRRIRARKIRPFTHGVIMQRPSASGFYRADTYVLSDLR